MMEGEDNGEFTDLAFSTLHSESLDGQPDNIAMIGQSTSIDTVTEGVVKTVEESSEIQKEMTVIEDADIASEDTSPGEKIENMAPISNTNAETKDSKSSKSLSNKRISTAQMSEKARTIKKRKISAVASSSSVIDQLDSDIDEQIVVPKPKPKPKSVRKRSLHSADSIPPKSILNVGGKVGEKLRENFCRLMNKVGPGMVTCRQCILQVNRARVFPDDRREIPQLLSHLQLHEDVERDELDQEDDHDQEEEGEKTPPPKTVATMKVTPTKERKTKSKSKVTDPLVEVPNPSVPEVPEQEVEVQASQPSPVQTEETQVSVLAEGAGEVPTTQIEIPSSSTEEAPTILVTGTELESYACALCNVTLPTFEEFIAHSVAEHHKTKFSLQLGEKTGEKDLFGREETYTFEDVASAALCADTPQISLVDVDTGELTALETTSQDPFHEFRFTTVTSVEGTTSALPLATVVADNTAAEPSSAESCAAPAGGTTTETVIVTVGRNQRPAETTTGTRKRVRNSESTSSRSKAGKQKKEGGEGEKEYVGGPFVCIECGEGEPDCYRLREHMTRMHGDRSRVFVCKTCNLTYSEKNFNQFQKHMNSFHADQEIACYFCRLTFKTCVDIRYHQAQHRPPLNFSCPYCYLEYSWILESEFTAHVLSHQGEESPFQCRQCEMRFGDFVARREHQTLEEHDEQFKKFHDHLRPYICTGCGKQFVNTGKTTGVRALRQHICQSGVTLDPRFECQYCHSHFPLGRSLRQHMREKHEQHMCHVCGRVCPSKASLDEHVGSEHFYSQFPCPVCQETFDTSQKMKQHKTREHGSRDFICEFCGQGFAGRLLLVRHLKKHDEFRGFVCSVCGDKFLLADRLETHFRKYHAHVVSDQDYETIILDNVQTAIATETIAVIQAE